MMSPQKEGGSWIGKDPKAAPVEKRERQEGSQEAAVIKPPLPPGVHAVADILPGVLDEILNGQHRRRRS
jgi:hypothetical protein